MKTLRVEQATLDACVRDAQGEQVVITRDGRPVAIVVGVEGLDDEQMQLSRSDDFWKLISERRKQPGISRAELERRIAQG